jgi:glycosyltransferase involved in cell wall biosynthesis
MTFSIIIPTLNEERLLPRLLRDLKKQSCPPDQIIVVDAKSKDKTVTKAKEFSGVKIIKADPGLALQRTLGGHQASSEWLIFLDADVRLEKHFMRDLALQIEKLQLDAACPRYSPLTKSIPVRLIFRFFNTLFWLGQWRYFPSGIGSTIVIRKTLFQQLRGFRTSLKMSEDLDFIYRAGINGKFRILPITVKVSDRRFMKYGIWHTFKQYLHISWAFLRHRLRKTNSLEYPFGEHEGK